jgi:3' exoribonuclease, RNase T-like
MKLIDVMLDLETLGLAPGCKILSIGAVTFSASGVGSAEFYQPIIRAGQDGFEDAGTVAWWGTQTAAAKANLLSETDNAGKVALPDALTAFAGYLGELAMIGPVRVWGNGAAFDNAVLLDAYRRCGMRRPWSYSHDMCFRTLRALAPHVAGENYGTAHNALDDAVAQAGWAARILTVQRALR